MKLTFFLLAFLIVNIGLSYAQGTTTDLTSCIQGNAYGCAAAVGLFIYQSVTQWNQFTQVPFHGMTCSGGVKGGWYKWKWKWQGQFSCPGWPVMGLSVNWDGREGAMKHAVVDFMQKALQAKSIKRLRSLFIS